MSPLTTELEHRCNAENGTNDSEDKRVLIRLDSFLNVREIYNVACAITESPIQALVG